MSSGITTGSLYAILPERKQGLASRVCLDVGDFQNLPQGLQ
jgi:hypothetical protein